MDVNSDELMLKSKTKSMIGSPVFRRGVDC
jgi:hypothetical protein